MYWKTAGSIGNENDYNYAVEGLRARNGNNEPKYEGTTNLILAPKNEDEIQKKKMISFIIRNYLYLSSIIPTFDDLLLHCS